MIRGSEEPLPKVETPTLDLIVLIIGLATAGTATAGHGAAGATRAAGV